MPVISGSVLQRRRLGTELKRIRREKGLTLDQVHTKSRITRSRL
ncbi:cytoskeletal protein RodZ, partial [Embleya sp. AB8]